MILEPTFSASNFGESTDFKLNSILNEEDSPFSIPLPEGILITSLPQDLSLIEDQITLDENREVIDNNLHFDNSIIDNDFSESISYTYNADGDVIEIQGVAAATDGLDLVGGFGDYDGGNDLTLEVRDNQNNVIETFSLTGAGQGTLYKDDEKEYIFFSGTDETTKVDIDAVSNLEFEDYIGDSLTIETTGSIEAGNITLAEDDDSETDTGLTLRAGVNGANINNAIFDSYSIVDFGASEMVDINYYGHIVGNFIDSDGQEKIFFYDGVNAYTYNNYFSSRAFGINDSSIIIGEGFTSADDAIQTPFLVLGNGSTNELEYEIGRQITDGNGETLFYEPVGSIRDISNPSSFATANYLLNIPPRPDLPFFEEAFFLSDSEAVNIGFSILDSENSRAFGINDLNQVVGINRETNRAFIYNQGSNSVTELGVLPGQSSSTAYAINNQGQVVGSSGSRAFFYEDGMMQDIGVSFTADPTKRLGIDINNEGQGIVTSAAGHPYLYEDGVLSNINDLLNPLYEDLNLEITAARSINDRGQIIVQATFNDSDRGFLLNPSYIPNDTVKVGNISTFGESVILEGDQVFLDGESMVTEGGAITVRGKTTVNQNLLINSSVTDVEEGEVAGANIDFVNTVNSNSEGEQSLTIKAGSGDLIFREAVGDENPLFDLKVEGTGKLTANGDLTVDNELHLEVINEITTANITAAGLAKISLGTIGEDTFSSTGNVTLGNVETLSLEVSNNGNFTAGDLTTSDGGINVISLNELAVGQLTATNGVVDLISGNAGISVSGTIQGDFGFSALAQLDINTNKITSGQNETESGLSEDWVVLNSSQGAINVVGSISAFGDVALTSANDISAEAISTEDGGVTLTSSTGIIAHSGTISSMDDVTLASRKDLTINQRIKTKLGTISLFSEEGSVKANTSINSGFHVSISAKQDINTLGLVTNGGFIALEAQQGRANLLGNIRSDGGNVQISSLGRIVTRNIVSKGGDISIASNASSIITGYLRADRGDKGGDINLEAAGNIKVFSSTKIAGVDYSIYTGQENTIGIDHKQLRRRATANEDFAIGNIDSSGTLAFIVKPPINPNPTPIEPLPIFKPKLPPRPPGEGQPLPSHVDLINPLTGEPYNDVAEKNLVENLTRRQQISIKSIIDSKKEYLREVDAELVVSKGRTDDETGCFYVELPGHLETDSPGESLSDASQYATVVSGSRNDLLVVDENGLAAFYDGLVNSSGKATWGLMLGGPSMPVGSVVETKLGYEWLNHFIKPENELPPGFQRAIGLKHEPDLDLDDFQFDPYDEVERMKRQINIEAIVARNCGLVFFVSFNRLNGALSGRELFQYPQTKKIVNAALVHRITAPFQILP